MAFPLTTVLDNFDRADGDLGSNWTGDSHGYGWPKMDVASNRMKCDASDNWSSAY